MSVRNDMSRLRKNRMMHFQIAMICSLSFVVLAFSWTVPRENLVLEEVFELEGTPMVVTPVTIHRPPAPPPPTIEEKVEILEPKPVVTPVKIEAKVDAAPVEVPITEMPIAPQEPKKVKVITKPNVIPLEIEEPVVEPEITYNVVGKMPRFSGCEDATLDEAAIKQCAERKLFTFLKKNLKYPAIARENGIEGLVVVQFIVEKDGRISDMKVVRPVGGGCSKEALRVVEKMPKWIPGEQRGRPVKVRFNLPVKFALAKG